MTLSRVACLGALIAIEAFGCRAKIVPNGPLVDAADVIVRAEAVDAPLRSGVVEGVVRFRVLETIRGAVSGALVLPGALDPHDDFNDRETAERGVRPNGRRGDCFASSYRLGAQYLLLLKKSKSGELDVRWAPLAPVNEQLHSDHDPWLLWVRQRSKRSGK